ncbi:MAG: hypothetical protein FK730_02485 [Asgard group archaeon]|nr:hypothetical protein [Asgard group archaeon]
MDSLEFIYIVLLVISLIIIIFVTGRKIRDRIYDLKLIREGRVPKRKENLFIMKMLHTHLS